MPIKMPNLTELTSIQKQILNTEDKYQVVLGGPGTGKTMLAILKCKQLYNRIVNGEKDLKVSFVVYNKPLQLDIEKIFNDFNMLKPDPNTQYYLSADEQIISLRSTDSWLFCYLYNILDKVNPKYTKEELKKKTYKEKVQLINENYKQDIDTGNDPFKPYDWNKVNKAFEKVNGNNKIYDYFIIDEAQDLNIEIFRLIKKYSKHIMIFFDENQRIVEKHRFDILKELDCEEQFYDLFINFRNTKPIERLINLFGKNIITNGTTLKSITAKDSGELPELIDVANDDNYDKLINYILDYKLKYMKESIGIILPLFNKYDDKSLGKEYFYKYKDLIEKKINEINSKPYMANKTKIEFKYSYGGESNYPKTVDDDSIYLLTYNTAKGMEFDNTFLLELNNEEIRLGSELDKKRFYVALSRARKRLHLVYDSTIDDSLITKTIKENEEKNLVKQIYIDDVSKDLTDEENSIESTLPF